MINPSGGGCCCCCAVVGADDVVVEPFTRPTNLERFLTLMAGLRIRGGFRKDGG